MIIAVAVMVVYIVGAIMFALMGTISFGNGVNVSTQIATANTVWLVVGGIITLVIVVKFLILPVKELMGLGRTGSE